MHRCLAVPEIVELIAQFAEDKASDNWCQGFSSPSGILALTCRAFYEPASNVHWSHLRSFKPLFRLFFAESKAVVKHSKGPIPLETFIQAADAKSWAPFLRHARRVRKLSCRWTWDVVAYIKVLHRFRPEKGEPLLPGLQSLTCIISDGAVDSTFPIEALAHHGLRSLRMVYHVKALEPPSLLFLYDKAPMVQQLYVSFVGLQGTVRIGAIRSFMLLVPSLIHLKSLVFTDASLPSSILIYLGGLPNLQRLNISINGRSTLMLPEDNLLFPSLQTLWLSGCAGSDVANLLQAISSRYLKSLYIVAEEQPTSFTISRWTGLVAKHLCLKDFNIRLRREVMRNLNTSAVYLVDDIALRPLLGLSQLTKLGLRDLPLELTDDFIGDMAASWPHLQELIMGVSVRMRTTGITMEGLRPISTHCSELYLLAVSVKMPSAPASVNSKLRWLHLDKRGRSVVYHDTLEAVEEAAGVKCRLLRYLDVGSSVIEDPFVVASFISRYFPNVRQVSDLWNIFISHKSTRKVNELLLKYGKDRWEHDDTQYNSSDIRLFARAIYSETAPMIF